VDIAIPWKDLDSLRSSFVESKCIPFSQTTLTPSEMPLHEVYALYSHIITHQDNDDSAFKFGIDTKWLNEQVTPPVEQNTTSSPPLSTATTPHSPVVEPEINKAQTGLDQNKLGDLGGSLKATEELNDTDRPVPDSEVEKVKSAQPKYVDRSATDPEFY
jgi:hypothetical protein